MALDRQSIQRTDFPVARQGYDPAAVDAHLRASPTRRPRCRQRPTRVRRWPPRPATTSARSSRRPRAARPRSAARRRTAPARCANEREQHADDLSASTAAMLERLEATKRELESRDRVAARAGRRACRRGCGCGRGCGWGRGAGTGGGSTGARARARGADAPAGSRRGAGRRRAEPVGVQSERRRRGRAADRAATWRSTALRAKRSRSTCPSTTSSSDRDQLLDEVYASVEG